MNTDITDTIAPTRLTTKDLEEFDLNIGDLLNGIFASDVDLKEILNKGLDEIKKAEKAAAKKKAKKAAKAKAARKAKKAKKAKAKKKAKRKASTEVVLNGWKTGLNGAVALTAGSAAVLLTNPIGWGLLATTATVRTAKYGYDLRISRKVRDAKLKGAVVTTTDEAELRALLGNARFETLLGLADAGVMANLGILTRDPVWAVLGVIHLLNAGFAGMAWSDASAALGKKGKGKKKSKPGAHKATIKHPASLALV